MYPNCPAHESSAAFLPRRFRQTFLSSYAAYLGSSGFTCVGGLNDAGEPGAEPELEKGQRLVSINGSSESLAGAVPNLAGLTSLAGRAWGRMVSFTPQVLSPTNGRLRTLCNSCMVG